MNFEKLRRRDWKENVRRKSIWEKNRESYQSCHRKGHRRIERRFRDLHSRKVFKSKRISERLEPNSPLLPSFCDSKIQKSGRGRKGQACCYINGRSWKADQPIEE